MDGFLGGNFIGDAGISYENAAAWARDVGGRFAVAINGGSKLTAQLQGAGATVLHRIKAPSHNDDSVLQYSARAFVELLHRDAPPGAVLYVANENMPSTALDRWLISAIEVAEEPGINRKLCIGNWTTHTKYIDLLLVKRAIQRAIAGGHYNGAHVYFPHGGISASLNHDMNGWLKLAKEVGGPWIITELAFAAADSAGNIDPHAGHIGRIGEAGYVALLDAAARFYAAQGAYATVFSYGRWHNFEVENSDTLKQGFTTINRTVTVVEMQKFVNVEELGALEAGYVESVTAGFANVRSEPRVALSTDIGDAFPGDLLEVRPRTTGIINGYNWYSVRRNEQDAFIATTSAKLVAGLPDTPRANLNVPFVSQTDLLSNLINNDCREACVAMLHRFAVRRWTGVTPTFPTVNALVTQGTLTPRPDTLTTTQSLADMLVTLGIPAELRRGLTLEDITAQLRDGSPVAVLTQYSLFEPGRTFGHFAVVVSYGHSGFWLHDPYKRGKDVRVTSAALLAGMQAASAFPQGVVLT